MSCCVEKRFHAGLKMVRFAIAGSASIAISARKRAVFLILFDIPISPRQEEASIIVDGPFIRTGEGREIIRAVREAAIRAASIAQGIADSRQHADEVTS